jgi:molybdopterin-containing oxidoreductase family membrane subunit
MGIWPQFRSPLIWDVFAVSTYGTVSALFWYTGLVPDLASLRDRAKNIHIKRLFGALALGWRGSARHWGRYETAYLLLAGMSTPLVLSVHTVVSFDFSIGIVPGWHATIFPPYFVAGAVYAGFAMVLTLAIPLRKWYGMEDFITMRHIENMAKVMLVNRMTGPYAWSYWCLIFCNGLMPQTMWSKKLRTNTTWLFILSLIVSVGMWLERFVIIVTSLHRDFLPSSWDMYYPTIWDFSTFFGTIGLFTTLMFLFVRLLPMISIFEVRTLVPEAKVKLKHDPTVDDFDVSYGAD